MLHPLQPYKCLFGKHHDYSASCWMPKFEKLHHTSYTLILYSMLVGKYGLDYVHVCNKLFKNVNKNRDICLILKTGCRKCVLCF